MTDRVTSASFIGRQEELGQLRRALQSAAAGRPGTLLIAGEAGVGKTRLVEEFAGQVAQQAQILLGHCLQLFSFTNEGDSVQGRYLQLCRWRASLQL